MVKKIEIGLIIIVSCIVPGGIKTENLACKIEVEGSRRNDCFNNRGIPYR